MMNMKQPSSDFEALVLALTLAVTASDEEHVSECVQMAEELAGRLTEHEVERAKKIAKETVERIGGN